MCFQVLPSSLGVHAGLDGSFTVLAFDNLDEPEVAYVEHTASALHLDKEAEVRKCNLAFDRLRTQALSPRDSVVLVERLVANL